MEESAYVKRAKQEEKRHKLATDDGFWFCICFKTQQDKDDFCDLLGIPGDRFLSGKVLEEKTEKYKPNEVRRALQRQVPAFPGENPLQYVEYNGNLEHDAIAEAAEIFAAFQEAKPPEKIRHASQTDIYICACFRSTDDALEYQSSMRINKFGSRYLDGSAWLKELKKNGENA